MSIEINYNKKTGTKQFKYTKHILVSIAVPLIISGVAALSSPLWLNFLVVGLEQINIISNEEYLWIIPTIQILIGLILLSYKYLIIDKYNNQKKIDRSILARAELDISTINGFLNTLSTDHSYYSKSIDIFVRSYSFFAQTSNNLQSKKIKNAYQDYAQAAYELNLFLGVNCRVFPSTQTNLDNFRYCLMPSGNIDRDNHPYNEERSLQYDKLSAELDVHIKKTRSSFNEFIEIIQYEELM